MPRVACILVLLATLGIGLETFPAAAGEPLLLGSLEHPAPAGEIVPQWRRVLAAIRHETPVIDACARDRGTCRGPLAAWLDRLDELQAAPASAKVAGVQDYVNRWPYRTDLETYGRSDLWASPLQFLANAGDCEDFAIAKYVSLRRLGLAAEQLRIVVLEDTARRLAHAVLTVRLGGEILVLDNLAPAPLPQAQLGHYQPYYSVNELGQWQHDRPAVAVATGDAVVRPAMAAPPAPAR